MNTEERALGVHQVRYPPSLAPGAFVIYMPGRTVRLVIADTKRRVDVSGVDVSFHPCALSLLLILIAWSKDGGSER